MYTEYVRGHTLLWHCKNLSVLRDISSGPESRISLHSLEAGSFLDIGPTTRAHCCLQGALLFPATCHTANFVLTALNHANLMFAVGDNTSSPQQILSYEGDVTNQIQAADKRSSLSGKDLTRKMSIRLQALASADNSLVNVPRYMNRHT